MLHMLVKIYLRIYYNLIRFQKIENSIINNKSHVVCSNTRVSGSCAKQCTEANVSAIGCRVLPEHHYKIALSFLANDPAYFGVCD